jgi:uncharacterized membrane protein YbhN (UPF0104 family)
VASALAAVIAAIAVVAIARVTGADAVGRAFAHLHGEWIGVVAAAELLTYPAYTIAYRSIARVHGHIPLTLPTVARIVVAGFGPFALAGGFGIDKEALFAINDDERSARVRVLALGALEWAVLAPTACAVSIVLLVTGADILPSLLWPWAVGVPVGLVLALWASAPQRSERLSRIRGKRRELVAQALEAVAVLRTLFGKPRTYAGAWVGIALYWGADICAFYGSLRTFGLHPGAGKVIIAYATGYAATRRSLPLGGAGMTEALMTYSLYWVREPLAPALAAVLVYRVFNFLLVAVPAIVAHRQLEPVYRAAARLRRPARPPPDG